MATVERNILERQRTSQAKVQLDNIDLRILIELQRDGRISKMALAEIVGLSPSSCFERMKRLEKKKLIVGYHATVNLKAFSSLHTFLTEITLKTHRAHDFNLFENYIQRVDEVTECYALGGGIDYLVKIVCFDVEKYQVIMDKLLDAEIGIDRYFTYIVTKPIKLHPQLPLRALIDPSAD